MQKSKYFLFGRNVLLTYASIMLIAMIFSFIEKPFSLIELGQILIVVGVVIGFISSLVILKSDTRGSGNLDVHLRDGVRFNERRKHEKPVEFVVFSIISACALAVATGYLFFKL
jgi:hypothetical protein